MGVKPTVKLLPCHNWGGEVPSDESDPIHTGPVSLIYEPVPRLVHLHRRLGDARLTRWLNRYSVGQSAEAIGDLLEAGQDHADSISAIATALAGTLLARGVSLVTILDPEYPACLRSLDTDAPPILYVQGSMDRLKVRSIAIIGTRRPTAEGRAAARCVARAAATSRWAVVSGNAPGIDSAAHEEAIAAGGETLVFPPAPMDQYSQNFRGNCPGQVTVASPFVPGSTIEPWMFLRRNSLVAAHCYAAFVAETGTRGGTLDTVKKLRQLRRATFATALPESPKFARAHAMLAAGDIHLLDVLNEDSPAARQVLDEAAKCVRHPAMSTPVLDDLFPEEFCR